VNRLSFPGEGQTVGVAAILLVRLTTVRRYDVLVVAGHLEVVATSVVAMEPAVQVAGGLLVVKQLAVVGMSVVAVLGSLVEAVVAL